MVTRYHLSRARSLDFGETLTTSRQEWDRVPAGFAETRSIRPGTVYREDRPTGPLVVRVRDDRVVLRRDRFHPRSHPLKYLRHDVLGDRVRPTGAVASLVLGN